MPLYLAGIENQTLSDNQALDLCRQALGCFSVYLVQFHDASWTFRSGAAVNAAEAETAAGTRHHEPSTLRPEWRPWERRLHKPRHVGHAGLAHTAPAGGSPLFCCLPSRGCKCPTGPLSVHEMSAVQQNDTVGNAPSPRPPGPSRGRGTAVCLAQLPGSTAAHLLCRACPQPRGK